jgi:UDP-N-acetylglucosamine--N-acetylmuramyl-(pentapeptide) pyrophosphoryl-undecaprenol N-acetylglucosamine transferase
MMAPNRTIVLAAGGTGGHVFPASALATEMKNRGWRVIFVTDNRGGTIGGMEDIETFHVRAGGIAGKRIIGLMRSIPELCVGTVQAWLLLRRLNPDVVVGFGGYASVPTMLAATYGKFLTAIHEQNAVLGRANRLMANRVDAIATSYTSSNAIPSDVEDRVTHTGMPVRPEIVEASKGDYPAITDDSKITLFVMGGSQGASVLSDVVPEAIKLLDPALRSRLNVVQQCRAEDLDRVRSGYARMDVPADLQTFFGDVPDRLADAHLLIGRAGASSVSEALSIGRPAILVPYPHAVDDHQSANAYAVAAVGAGWVMDQTMFTPENLSSRLAEMFGAPRVLKAAAACARKTGRADAAVRLADVVERVVETNGSSEQPHEGNVAA